MNKMSSLKIFFFLAVNLTIAIASDSEKIKISRKLQEWGVFLFVFVILTIAILVRYVIQRFNLPIPYGIFIISLGMLWGVVMLYSEPSAAASKMIYSRSQDVLTTYTSLVLFRLSFCVEAHAFLKSIYQILIISAPIGIICICFTGLIMRLVINYLWPYSAGIFFGMVVQPIYPLEVVKILGEIGVHTKHTSILLEGESIIGTAIYFIMGYLLEGYKLGFLVHWYQYIMVLIRYVIVGPLFSYFVGFCGCFLMRWMSQDITSLTIVTITLPILAFYISFLLIARGSVISVIIPGLMMGKERTALAPEIDKMLVDFWKVTTHVLNTLVFAITGVTITYSLIKNLTFQDYVFIVVTYLVNNIGRLISFLLFYPVLRRVGYGMTIKNMIICVWGGLKSPISLAYSLTFYNSLRYEAKLLYLALPVASHVFGVYILTVLINGSLTPVLFKIMGLTEVSMARQVNMNNCMKYVSEKRERATCILKMDKFLNDINWTVLRTGTTLKHPYKINLTEIDQDEDNYFLGYRFTVCPECNREIFNEPTVKELKDMTREARLRILKAQRVCYMRQYENGMISKEANRILSQLSEAAMDTNDALIDLNPLYKLFKNKGFFDKFIISRVEDLREKTLKPHHKPTTYWRRVAYHIVTRPCFEIVICIFIVFNIIPVAFELGYYSFHDNWSRNEHLAFAITNVVFVMVYAMEFVLKIMAYSYVHVCKHGFKQYFSSKWNTLDFVLLIISVVDMVIELTVWIVSYKPKNLIVKISLAAMKISRFLRLMKMVRMCGVCYPKTIRYFNSRIDSNMAFAYELGKGYVSAVEEVLDMLPYMIDSDQIRDEIKQRMEQDKLEITRMLGLTQKEKPWIAITVKTKQAMRTILNNMYDTIHELKVSGWVDDAEYEILMKSLGERYKYAARIKSVQPSPPEVIFKELSWMAGEQTVINYLYDNVCTRRFDPGEVVCAEDIVADGVYIVVTGLFMLSYNPKTRVLNNLINYGMLPVVDYMPPSKFYEPLVDYIVSGNSIGELSVITGRPYNCKITADTHSTVYFLSRDVMKKAMEMSTSRTSGLTCRIWRSIGVRMALPILMNISAYQSTAIDKIRYALERAFMPNLGKYNFFVVNDMIEDVMIIEGVVKDAHSKENYVAPCYIPRTVKKLSLPSPSQLNMPAGLQTKLLIIPAKDLEGYDLTLEEDGICELISINSTRCLQHVVQRRFSRRSTRTTLSFRGNSVEPSSVYQYRSKSGSAGETDSTILRFFKGGADSEHSVTNVEMLEHEAPSPSRRVSIMPKPREFQP